MTVQALPATRLWTVEEYHRMVEVGIISPDERVELIEGEVISMAAKKPPHVVITELAVEYLRELCREVAYIRTQDPVFLNDRTEPEPDIAVVMPPLRRYLDHHPEPEEIFLIIEVAESLGCGSATPKTFQEADATLKFDTKKKAAVYASTKIADYWVVDAVKRSIYVFREPVAGTYTKESILSENCTIKLLAFPEIEVVFQEFFP